MPSQRCPASALVPLLAVALVQLGARSLSAFVLLSPARSWDCAPDYIVDNRAGGIASIQDPDGGETRIVNAITSAGDAWNGAGSGRVIKAHRGSIAGFALADGVPMINLTDPLASCTGSCLAATFATYYSERSAGSGSWRIDDADIVTNSSGHSWTSQGEDPGGAACGSETYVEAVMVHEAGHALGMGHSPVPGSTMLSSISACDNGSATIEVDDQIGLLALYGVAPCAACDANTDHIAASGTTQYQPCGTYYFGSAGLQNGSLHGPAGADFDLYLYHLSGGAWVEVASSTSTSNNEDVSYNGLAGYYKWAVYSYGGSGTYHFYSSHP